MGHKSVPQYGPMGLEACVCSEFPLRVVTRLRISSRFRATLLGLVVDQSGGKIVRRHIHNAPSSFLGRLRSKLGNTPTRNSVPDRLHRRWPHRDSDCESSRIHTTYNGPYHLNPSTPGSERKN